MRAKVERFILVEIRPKIAWGGGICILKMIGEVGNNEEVAAVMKKETI